MRYIGSAIFIMIAIGLIALGVKLSNNTNEFLAQSITVDGTVIDLIRESSTDNDGKQSTYFYPIFEFTTLEGETLSFRSNTGSYPASYKRGDNVTIHYLPNNPEHSKVDGFFSLWGWAIISGGIGAFLLILFIGGYGFTLLQGRRDNNLKEHGFKIEAYFVKTEPYLQSTTQSESADTKSSDIPHRIICAWEDPTNKKLYHFRSRLIPYDPSEYIDDEQTITVYLEHNNFKRYYVDIDFLPTPL